MTENSSIYKISKRGPCFWGSKWPILPQLCTSHQYCRHVHFFNFACRVHLIVIRQMKCETYGIFKSFFNSRIFYCIYPKFVLFPLTIICLLPLPQSIYLICLCSLTLNLTWRGGAMCKQQWQIHIFQTRSLFVTNRIFY